MPTWTRAACPKDGRRLVLVTASNSEGDDIKRWECPNGDWAGPWYAGHESGENEPIPEVSRNVQSVQSLGAPVGSADPVSIKDGTVATQKLAVDVTGKIGINNFPTIYPVTDNGGSLTVDDGGLSLTIDGTVALDAATLAALETVTVLQGTSPWVVSGTLTLPDTTVVIAQLPGVGGTPDPGSLWSVTHAPGVNTLATATKAAPGAGKALVITSATFSLVAGTVAPLATVVTGLITGATSGTVYSVFLAIPNTAGATTVISSPITIQGADNEALTVRFSGTAGANTQESVHMNGYVVTL